MDSKKKLIAILLIIFVLSPFFTFNLVYCSEVKAYGFIDYILSECLSYIILKISILISIIKLYSNKSNKAILTIVILLLLIVELLQLLNARETVEFMFIHLFSYTSLYSVLTLILIYFIDSKIKASYILSIYFIIYTVLVFYYLW